MEQLTMAFPDASKGYKCPCCDQFVKTYLRKLNSSMARVLILIYKSGNLDYFHVENWLKSINKPELRADFHKLRYWRLLKKKVENRGDGSPRNGFYRITPPGIMFVEGKITVPESMYVFNNEFKGFKGEEIFIWKALGNKFNYTEMMGQ